MSDETTPASTPDEVGPETTADASSGATADTTPTQTSEAVAPRVPASGSGRTRTILEIVGGVAAAVLVVTAAGAGFTAGLMVGDDGDRHRGYQQAGEMRFDGGRDGGNGMGRDHRDGHRHSDGMPGGGPADGMHQPPMPQPPMQQPQG